MSDLTDEEIMYTKINNDSISLYAILDYWYVKYGVPEYQIAYMKNRLDLLKIKE